MKNIQEIATNIGLSLNEIELYSNYAAKIPLELLSLEKTQTPLVVVTGINPTPMGEGKTTTSIGLVQGLAKEGASPVLTLREPSLGPVFGIKGGGTGGGKSIVIPEDKINLHFTGDAHAVTAAHNLLAALTDAACYHQTIKLNPENIQWKRVTNSSDRSLRQITTGLGSKLNGPKRNTGFDIDAASEIMAILSLANGYDDLKKRLSNIIIGYTENNHPILAKEINAVGAMMALLQDALKPNLTQTIEGQPAIIHTGPFGNIAHGCSSILADKFATQFGNIVVTEAGFGADLGFEKFIHIKTRYGAPKPNAAIIVATIRALKWHGGATLKELTSKNMAILKKGISNLEHAINIVNLFGIPAVVAINKFPEDSEEEINFVRKITEENGATAIESLAFSHGGDGTRELASLILEKIKNKSKISYLYNLTDSIESKINTIATKVYGASGIELSDEADKTIKNINSFGANNLPICIAKTHLSISSNPKLLGSPTNFSFPISAIRISKGAGFIYPLAGNIRTLPGLPKIPNASKIHIDKTGEIKGLMSEN